MNMTPEQAIRNLRTAADAYRGTKADHVGLDISLAVLERFIQQHQESASENAPEPSLPDKSGEAEA